MKATLTQGGRVLAMEMGDAWRIYEDPKPGYLTLLQYNGWAIRAAVVGIVRGVLVLRRSNGALFGVTWKEGTYLGNWIRNRNGRLATQVPVEPFSLDNLSLYDTMAA